VELEYETAIENKLEIRIYIIDEERANIPPKFVDCENANKLKEFKNRLKVKHTICSFNSVADFSVTLKNDVEKIYNTRFTKVERFHSSVSAIGRTSIVAKGDDYYIDRITSEISYSGVGVWIFGKNKFCHSFIDVQPDGKFIFKIPSEKTKSMQNGEYFVVIQHPAENQRYDVIPLNLNNTVVVKNSHNNESFIIKGPNSVSGFDASLNLVQFLNKSTIDDTYTKLQFLVEEPKITISFIPPKKEGEKFTIRGMTNLSVDNEILIQIIPKIVDGSKFYPIIQGIVKVETGTQGFNTYTFFVDLASVKPGEYLINVISYKIGVLETSNLLIK
jgi:trimeric autotransporter adhesin